MLRTQTDAPPASNGSVLSLGSNGDANQTTCRIRQSSSIGSSAEQPSGQKFSDEIAKAAIEREERKKRRKRKEKEHARTDRRRGNRKNNGRSGSGSSREAKSQRGGSVVWTVLVIGLVFCMLDVLYMMRTIDREDFLHAIQRTADSSFASSVSSVSSAIAASAPLTDTQDTQQAALDRHRHQQQHNNKPRKQYDQNGNQKDENDSTDGDEKGYILHLLKEAGVPIDPQFDRDIYDELPTWQEVVDMYGDRPVIYGLEQCEAFQTQSDPADHFVSTAGTFNTGTNLMAELLIANCHMPARMAKYGYINRGIRWQVPWGKHTPPGDEEFRLSHKTQKDKDIDANNILPAVTIRDPLVWLGSMCRHQYAAHWRHDPDDCPNFSSRNLHTMVQYSDFQKHHESILHHWNDFYNEYLNVRFHRLIVRFEDLVFHAREVTETVCHCAGGAMRKDGKFQYIVNSAKKGAAAHGKERTGYLDAIVRYGNAARRYSAFKRRSDLEYVRDNVDKNLMEIMNYPLPDVTRFD